MSKEGFFFLNGLVFSGEYYGVFDDLNLFVLIDFIEYIECL